MPHTNKPIYSNCRVLAPDGTLMFQAAERRARWYLDRRLAEVVLEDPLTIRLLFQPKGPGHRGDDYYLAEKQDICVVCGADSNLNKHHVIPRVYRRHFPDEIKSRSSHDVVVTCETCHACYETEAHKLKQRIAAEVGFYGPLTEPAVLPVRHPIAKTAITLLRHRDRIPQEKVAAMEATIREHLGRSATDADLQALSTHPPSRNPLIPDYGKYTVDRVDLREFALRWRSHFPAVMQPRFMPAGWDLNRPLGERR